MPCCFGGADGNSDSDCSYIFWLVDEGYLAQWFEDRGRTSGVFRSIMCGGTTTLRFPSSYHD